MGGIGCWVGERGLGVLVGLCGCRDGGCLGYGFMYFYSVSEPAMVMLHTGMASVVFVFA